MSPSPLFSWLQALLAAASPELPRPGEALPDFSQLTAEELGALWPWAYRQRHNFDSPAQRELAGALLEYGRRQAFPALDNESAVAVFKQIRQWGEAVQHLAWLTQPPCTELSAELVRILEGEEEDIHDDGYWAGKRYEAFCLSEVAGERYRARLRQAVAAHCGDSPYALREFALLPQLAFSHVLTLALSQTSYYHPREQDEFHDPARLLSEEPAYVALAQESLTAAADRLDDIQQGRIPYVADGAFSLEDAHVIARMARVAAWRDEAWFGPLIERLLPATTVAPTAAKTLPSQALAVALGHAVEGVPTPEGVRGLRRALEVVRHAGIQKKLARNLKPAERGLAQRPEIALRLGDALPKGKRAQGMLAACLEAFFWQETQLPAVLWQEKLLASAAGALVQTLIWTVQTPGQAARTFLPGRNGVLCTVDGAALTLGEQDRVALWHPLHSCAEERAAWQARIVAQRVTQPFRQAFREYYFPAVDDDGFHAGTFAGYLLALRPLLGLARGEGWRIGGGWDEGALLRRFGAFQAGFNVHARLYPGVAGWGESGDMLFWHQGERGWEEIAPTQLPIIIFSEICRAVDLLVSRTGIAAADDGQQSDYRRESHLRFLSETGRIGAMRRDAIRQVFAPAVAAGKLRLEGNRACVGEYAVNLTTGRATRGGAPITVQPQPENEKASPVFWLPYDETLLDKICATLRELLSSTH